MNGCLQGVTLKRPSWFSGFAAVSGLRPGRSEDTSCILAAPHKPSPLVSHPQSLLTRCRSLFNDFLLKSPRASQNRPANASRQEKGSGAAQGGIVASGPEDRMNLFTSSHKSQTRPKPGEFDPATAIFGNRSE